MVDPVEEAIKYAVKHGVAWVKIEAGPPENGKVTLEVQHIKPATNKDTLQ